MGFNSGFKGLTYINPLNAELNPICCLLALLGAHHFLHVSRIRVNKHIGLWLVGNRLRIRVNCTLVQALRLCIGRMAHRGNRGIAPLFQDNGTRRGWGVSFTPRPLFTPGKDPVPIVQEAGWAPGPVWTSAENLAPTGIRSPDRPARSQSLNRLRYPGLRIRVIQNYSCEQSRDFRSKIIPPQANPVFTVSERKAPTKWRSSRISDFIFSYWVLFFGPSTRMSGQ